MAFDNDTIKLARQVFPDLSETSFKLYLNDCERLGIHPLDKKLHPQVRKDYKTGAEKYAPVTSIDYMRLRAEATGKYAGSDDAAFTYPADRPDNPAAASVTVWKMVDGQRCGFTATARWKEYFPGDKVGAMWLKMPHVMLSKCAEALALRKGFPGELAGLYAKEEMDQSEAGEPRSLTPPSPVAAVVAGPVEGYITGSQRAELLQVSTRAGWALQDLKTFITKRTGATESQKIPAKDFATLLGEIERGPNKSLLVTEK